MYLVRVLSLHAPVCIPSFSHDCMSLLCVCICILFQMCVSPPTGSLPHIFLRGWDEEARQLEEVILCGPAQLPNVMKKVVNFKEHSDMLSAGE